MSRTAALWDEWADEDAFYGDPYAVSDVLYSLGGGSPAGGRPFLTDVFGPDARIMVEAAFGANIKGDPTLWNFYDITADVRQADGQRVNISPMGRSDEATQAQPAGCTFQLDNLSGDYSKNPLNKWWPFIRRTTPIRVRLYLFGTWYLRYQGEATAWVPSYDTTNAVPYVIVTASGVLRRINLRKAPFKSPLYRAAVISGPIAHWSLEDGSNSTQAASTIIGVPPMTVNTAIIPKFGNVTAPGVAGLVDFSGGGRMTGYVPNTDAVSWRVEFVAKFPAGGSAPVGLYLTAATWYTTGVYANFWVAAIQADAKVHLFMSSAQASIDLFEFISNQVAFDGRLHHYRVDTTPEAGSAIRVKFYIDGVLAIQSVTPLTGAVGRVTSIVINQEESISTSLPAIGSVGVWGPIPITSDTAIASTGYIGETATDRIVRICAEESIPVAVKGISQTLMGPQPTATLAAILRDCEVTDDGLLYDGLGPGLGYIARSTKQNAPITLTVDMTADPPQMVDFVPVDDDQRNRNIMKTDAPDGSSATYEDSTGSLGSGTIGDYDSSVPANPRYGGALIQRSSWEVHKGTNEEPYRYPQIKLDLAATPAIASTWLTTDLAERIDVVGASSKAIQHPVGTTSLLLEGYNESLSPFDWEVTGNTSSFEPWRVFVIGDLVLGRLDSEGSAINAEAATGATSLTVASTTAIKPWIDSATYPTMFPFDVMISGIQITVTAITGTSSPQTFTVTGVTKPLHAGDVVKIWKPGVLSL